jgi:hypothetical protein
MIFGGFCKISVFIEKEKMKEKEKGLHGRGLAHNEADPTAMIRPRSKKKPTRRGLLRFGHFASRTLIYFKNC